MLLFINQDGAMGRKSPVTFKINEYSFKPLRQKRLRSAQTRLHLMVGLKGASGLEVVFL